MNSFTTETKMNRFTLLMKDFGYKYEGSTLIRNGVRGFMSPRTVGRFKSSMQAAEYLCPIIADSEYTDRLIQISKPT